MQASTSDATAPDWHLADHGLLIMVMESALFFVVLMLSIMFTLLALSYLQTYFRSRLERKIASKRATRRPKKSIPITRPASGESI